MILQIVGGIIRAVLAAYGGRLVEQGLLTDQQLTQGVGAVIVLVTIAWSIWQKSRAHTVPGGAFNPDAMVKKATSANTGGTPVPPCNDGSASVDALLLIAMVFLVLGMALYALPSPLVDRPVPEVVCGRPAGEWLQVVQVEDRRPFFARLVASLRCRPGLAVVYGTNATNGTDKSLSVSISKVEITGGAKF